MKAVGLYRYLNIDHPESLLDLEIDKPVAQGRDLLVKIKAVSVNPVDTKVRKPKDRTESVPRILGWDAAGIVEETGLQCTLFKPGDEVFYAGSNIRQGSNSEYQLVDERIVGRKPNNLDFAGAAAIPLTAITAWEGMFDRLGIPMDPQNNQGKKILIIGAAGGVGSIATQLAKLAGLTVIGTASRAESREWALHHGADLTINHFDNFTEQLKTYGWKNVDYIFCLNSTDMHWENMAEAIAPQGKICSIVESPVPLNLTLLQGKSATFVWELMFTRPMFETEDMIQQHELLNKVADYLEEGLLKTTMTERLEPINAANLKMVHKKIETGRTIGKIVLENF